tara:strand:- start:2033 stop:2437 length:405 start_codon:yes stop_codon:yes gene_type:complete
MSQKFLKKIIAQNQDDVRVISALCSEAKVKLSEIRYLKKNKIFLISLERHNKEKTDSKDKIHSILKFEFIEQSKSKNINQNEHEKFLELLAIDIFKKEKNYEIVLLFSNNGIITLEAEVIEIELDNVEKLNDKN